MPENLYYFERNADGIRIGPDGEPISIIMELDQGRTTYIDTMELVKPTWAKVGVEVNVKTMERSLWEERCRRRNLEFHASKGAAAGRAPQSGRLGD